MTPRIAVALPLLWVAAIAAGCGSVAPLASTAPSSSAAGSPTGSPTSSATTSTTSSPNTASTITLSGAIDDTVTATAGPICVSTSGGNAPVAGAAESDWALNHAGSAEGILTWYSATTSDQTVSLETYDLSLTISVDSHNLNGTSGTVAQSQAGREIRFDISLTDADDSTFIVHAVGDLTC